MIYQDDNIVMTDYCKGTRDKNSKNSTNAICIRIVFV